MTNEENVQNIKWEKDPYVFVFKEEIPGRIKMHVKQLDLRDWVRIDKTYPAQMQERKRLYETKISEIFVSNHFDSTEKCKWELFELLVDYLPKRFPQIFERRNSHIYNKVTSCSIPTDKADDLEDPLLRIGRLTQEDWLILEYDEDQSGYVLTAGLLCFPMCWKLTEKFNKVLTDIHSPVKAYQKHLKDKVANLFLKMTSKTCYWRSNWGIYAGLKSPLDLFIHPSTAGETLEKFPFESYETGNRLFLRCEYQTVRKLPQTKCIVFSIRTYQRYMSELRDLPVENSEALLASIQSMDKEFLEYKGGNRWESAAVRYLQLIISDRRHFFRKVTNKLQQACSLSWFLPIAMFLGIAAATLMAVVNI